MISSVNEPPSIDLWYLYMGDSSKTYGTYIWWEYVLEENDMKWDPFLERNMFSIIKDISYISSEILVLLFLETEITGSSQVVAICCTHNNSPFNLTI